MSGRLGEGGVLTVVGGLALGGWDVPAGFDEPAVVLGEFARALRTALADSPGWRLRDDLAAPGAIVSLVPDRVDVPAGSGSADGSGSPDDSRLPGTGSP